ncbi:hypothetical protein GLAREA_01655 [Glarea lozoyensis ATCC 20868]|uniref:Uncharacterized protein n=1 Tax=Glarea lozoyensis (strain ATCC 20868 / MF5171) TaxID=1116229 RepID=S3DGL8_GLAL2|nr:uncharacterized protein GLAREA_01655 [Glarea lozoyensis ATCC 20868]EPE25743.1 hypothetical protein GLAREA_01655 [Glarea lozoyensis ATCC 20868]
MPEYLAAPIPQRLQQLFSEKHLRPPRNVTEGGRQNEAGDNAAHPPMFKSCGDHWMAERIMLGYGTKTQGLSSL